MYIATKILTYSRLEELNSLNWSNMARIHYIFQKHESKEFLMAIPLPHQMRNFWFSPFKTIYLNVWWLNMWVRSYSTCFAFMSFLIPFSLQSILGKSPTYEICSPLFLLQLQCHSVWKLYFHLCNFKKGKAAAGRRL